MKRILLFILLFLGIISFACAKGLQTQESIDATGFPFATITKTANGNQITETDTAVWTPASGNKIVLMGVKFNSDTATTLLVESSTTAVIPLTECTASGQVVIQGSVPLWEGTDDATLTYTVATKGRHSILLWGFETP